jgi:hypothetical protein
LRNHSLPAPPPGLDIGTLGNSSSASRTSHARRKIYTIHDARYKALGLSREPVSRPLSATPVWERLGLGLGLLSPLSSLLSSLRSEVLFALRSLPGELPALRSLRSSLFALFALRSLRSSLFALRWLLATGDARGPAVQGAARARVRVCVVPVHFHLSLSLVLSRYSVHPL